MKIYSIYVDENKYVADPIIEPVLEIRPLENDAFELVIESWAGGERGYGLRLGEDGEIVQEYHEEQNWSFLRERNARVFFIEALKRHFGDEYFYIFERVKNSIFSMFLEEL